MQDLDEIIVVGTNLDDAIEKGCKYLKISDNAYNYDILSEEEGSVRIKISSSIKIAQKTDEFSNINGYFKILYNGDFAYIVVYPPEGNGKPVYVEDVVNRMKILNIPWVSTTHIKDIVEAASGTPEKLVECKDDCEYRSKIDIKISDDKMLASIIIIPPKNLGSYPSYDEIIFVLNETGVKYGINEDVIRTLIGQRLYNEEVVVAHGIEPIPANPGEIKYNFDTDPTRPFLFDEYDKIMLKELNFIQEIKVGDVVAEILSESPGVAGVDVFGVLVEVESDHEESLSSGNNMQLSEDGKKLTSLIDGYVSMRDGVITVDHVVRLDCVDYSTGNIEYDGAVIVYGQIADGFSIKATGNIQVGECVGRVNLYSDRDVILKSGIKGNSGGQIICGGNLYTRFIENAEIQVAGNCYAEDSIMNSNVEVSNNIVLIGRRAEIIGGHTIVGGNIKCKKIGSSFGVKTEIKVGIDPKKLHIIDELEKNISNKEALIQKLKISLNNCDKNLKILIELDQRQQENDKKNKILILLYRLKDELIELQREYAEAKNMLQPVNNRYVIVEIMIYCGTTITFGTLEYKVATVDISKIILRYYNKNILESGFQLAGVPDIF